MRLLGALEAAGGECGAESGRGSVLPGLRELPGLPELSGLRELPGLPELSGLRERQAAAREAIGKACSARRAVRESAREAGKATEAWRELGEPAQEATGIASSARCVLGEPARQATGQAVQHVAREASGQASAAPLAGGRVQAFRLAGLRAGWRLDRSASRCASRHAGRGWAPIRQAHPLPLPHPQPHPQQHPHPQHLGVWP